MTGILALMSRLSDKEASSIGQICELIGHPKTIELQMIAGQTIACAMLTIMSVHQ